MEVIFVNQNFQFFGFYKRPYYNMRREERPGLFQDLAFFDQSTKPLKLPGRIGWAILASQLGRKFRNVL